MVKIFFVKEIGTIIGELYGDNGIDIKNPFIFVQRLNQENNRVEVVFKAIVSGMEKDQVLNISNPCPSIEAPKEITAMYNELINEQYSEIKIAKPGDMKNLVDFRTPRAK